MTTVYWPTHKAKARERQSAAIRKRNRNRRLRRLYRDGKRGEAK